MTMTKVKTAELVGAQLDWAVALALGKEPRWFGLGSSGNVVLFGSTSRRPSTDWKDGGPILDREKIGLKHDVHGTWATHPLALCGAILGKDMLEAGCRAFVASKLGDVVEVPEVSHAG